MALALVLSVQEAGMALALVLFVHPATTFPWGLIQGNHLVVGACALGRALMHFGAKRVQARRRGAMQNSCLLAAGA